MAGPRVGGRGPHGMMPGEKAKDFKGTMGKLLTYLKKFLPSIILVLVCAAASTIFPSLDQRFWVRQQPNCLKV